ncbi:hypothetical protein [Sulfitobacter sp.]|uniref:hypothetical protein n=1 Tax=Sulfitobacter sp. TaxID=1903071 RepID=UPI00300323F1
MITGILEKNLAYFLLRELISKEGSNSFGKNNAKLVAFGQSLRRHHNQKTPPQTVLNNAFSERSSDFSSSSPNVRGIYANFKAYLVANVTTNAGIEILIVIVSELMPAINFVMGKVPTDQAQNIARQQALKVLGTQGDAYLETLINNWDDFTLQTCLSQENDLAGNLVAEADKIFAKNSTQLSSIDRVDLISAALQEFERRAGQKRKSRSGDDLQNAVITIFDHLGIKHDSVPQLISGVIEADLLIKHGNHNTLISCKRTGRERVKQATTSMAELQQLRIRKMVWFFTHFDQSPARVEDMGVRGNIFYLPDSSPDYLNLIKDKNCAKYVLPISDIRKTLPQIIRGTL